MISILKEVDLREYTTFGLRSVADRMICYSQEADLRTLFNDGIFSKKWFHIGGGSNLLFCGDFHGTILKSEIREIEVVEDNADGVLKLRVGAGVQLSELISYVAAKGIHGIENLAGIPGEVGGASVQNVGAYGVEFGDLVESVRCFDTITGKSVSFSQPECSYDYRYSRFKGKDKGRYIVVGVCLNLSKKALPVLTYGPLQGLPQDSSPDEIINTVIATRDGKLPQVNKVGSAGSFFKNPVIEPETFEQLKEKCGETPSAYMIDVDGKQMVKVSAAWLIDKSGWKGRGLGGAATWPTQPLVIVNKNGTATYKDVMSLVDAIIDDIERKYNISLVPEVEYVR